MLHQCLEGMGNGGRCGRLWRGNAMALADQLAGFGIDQTALDPRAANIHSQHMHLWCPFNVLTVTDRQSMKKLRRAGKGQIAQA